MCEEMNGTQKAELVLDTKSWTAKDKLDERSNINVTRSLHKSSAVHIIPLRSSAGIFHPNKENHSVVSRN